MKSLLDFLLHILYFPFWWYGENLSFWKNFVTRTLVLLADSLGFSFVTGVLFKPYRGDNSWIGRGIGFVIRLIWLLFTTIFLLVVIVILLSSFLIYLIFPMFLLNLVFVSGSRILGMAVLMILFWLYYRLFLRLPRKEIAQIQTSADLSQAATPSLRGVLRRVKNQKYSPVLAFENLLRTLEFKTILKRLDLEPRRLFEVLPRENTTGELSESAPLLQRTETEVFSGEVKVNWEKIFEIVLEVAREHNFEYFDVAALFLAVVKGDSLVEDAFLKLGIKFKQITGAVLWVRMQFLAKESWKYWKDEFFHRRGSVDVGWTAGFIPHLKHFSIDITRLVQQGALPIFVGREQQLGEAVRVLEQTTRNNVLLVGRPGCGKTTFVAGVAQRILSGELRGKLSHKKVIQLNIGGMLAGTSGRGELEERIGQCLAEVRKGETILFVDDIENLLKAGVEFFLPVLSAGAIQFIGTTTPKAYEMLIKPQEAFVVHFQIVRLSETNFEETMQILQIESLKIEAEQGVVFSYQALEAAINFTQRYIHDRVLPAKAVSLIDESAVFVAKQFEEGLRKKVLVGARDIAKILSRKLEVPIEDITQEESEKLLHLEDLLHQRIIDQEEAVSAVSNALRRARTGLTSEKRPNASFLFIGPTGVGKTETARALSDCWFGSEKNMVRLDMSEYNIKESVILVIERLCQPIKVKPFSLLLLDEIEKAHSDVHNLLLQVLEDGRLTDSRGETVDFSSTLVIGTSNAYSEYITASIKKGTSIERIKRVVIENLQKIFKPELLNRFDGIIVFKPLGKEEVEAITRLLLDDLSGRMTEQEIKVSFSDDVVEEIARLGFDPAFGARPLRRVIQEKIESPLAERILKGELKRGSKITVTKADIL